MMTLYGRFLLTMAVVLLLDWQVMLHAQNPSGRLAERFRELDADQNGVLSLTELGREKAVFDEIDANKDGRLTIREVGDYLRGGGKLRPITTPHAPPKEVVGEFTASMPVSLRSCRAAADYSRQSTGHAVLIMVDGATVYENYHNGWSVEAAHRLASGTKSFAGVAAAVARAGDGVGEAVMVRVCAEEEDASVQRRNVPRDASGHVFVPKLGATTPLLIPVRIQVPNQAESSVDLHLARKVEISVHWQTTSR